MNKLNYLLLNIFLLMFINASPVFSCANLYPINDKNGGGYINKNGKIIIEQKYNFAQNFVGNYAITQGRNLKYGIIAKNGNQIVDFKYEYLKNLNENFVIYKENEKYGYIDIEKNIKSKAVFDDIKIFKEGLAGVKLNSKWGFINKKGEIVIQPKYYNVSDFNEGLSAISYSKHTTSGYINKKGKNIISFADNQLEPREFSEGLAPFIKQNEKACSYINKKGKTIIYNNKISPINLYCAPFKEGLSVFYIDKNPKKIITGYVNKKGKIKHSMVFSVPDIYSDGEFSVFENFSSNMAQISIDYKTGYINKKFQLVIPVIYEFARDFNHDLAYVKFENKEGYINKKGKWVWHKEREGM